MVAVDIGARWIRVGAARLAVYGVPRGIDRGLLHGQALGIVERRLAAMSVPGS